MKGSLGYEVLLSNYPPYGNSRGSCNRRNRDVFDRLTEEDLQHLQDVINDDLTLEKLQETFRAVLQADLNSIIMSLWEADIQDTLWLCRL